MRIVIPASRSFNPELETPCRLGNADELSPAVMAEMSEHFGHNLHPTDETLDAMYEADMIRRDKEAADREFFSRPSAFVTGLVDVARDAEAAREASRKRFG